ncbi:MAG: helix-turn-helix domain-containing protein [Defluviitaleaceae bacterium]|nr:helix-turn-helix domain-containing protein [Defluviitaleaceae bacterium]
MNMQAIGKKISALRKQRDMTQVELADKLGVTYQAVSSWERGNSMPDIGKLPHISQVLNVTVDELLDNAEMANIVKNVLLDGEGPTDLQALVEIAPILKPSQMNNLAKQADSTEAKLDAELLEGLAPHMDSDDLMEIIMHSGGIDKKALIAVAPFLDSDDLKTILVHKGGADKATIIALAPFLDSDDLKEIMLAL